jgi:RimJ/RimL family protein N-acetyltransferase
MQTYQAAWLGVSPEFLDKVTGVVIIPNAAREKDAPGWPLPTLIYALQTKQALIISCSPNLEDRLHCLKDEPDIAAAAQKLKNLFVYPCWQLKVFWLAQPTAQFDTSRAVLLQSGDYEIYHRFQLRYRNANKTKETPEMEQIEKVFWEIQAKNFAWMAQRQLCFGIFEDGELVSVTDSSKEYPYLPENMVTLGIKTLPEYRRKGYASAACTAFISSQINNDIVPIWECEADNVKSAALAEKLGFQLFGEIFRLDIDLNSLAFLERNLLEPVSLQTVIASIL